ncbi:HutD family protein [Agromyces albus]|uniref:HutD family protein n=1 Tax=Agromyces albus TaxID=205332 RepID=A0A4Q2L6F5_9MICO|nr:HutD family protein [Agromyces albus]RXZ73177.1 hypothetical protein ESP51_00290 [Agromyces albus]
MLIQPAEKTSVPWANGRGSTRELAHDVRRSWRLSMADIREDAPFSTFPDIDRIFIVVDGEVRLRIDGVEHQLVAGAAVEFRGESAASAVAVADTAHVVNLMTVRGEAQFDCLRAEPTLEVGPPVVDDELVVFLSRGRTMDGIAVEPGTVLMKSSSEEPSAGSDAAQSSLRFTDPVAVYRLTPRS